MTIKPPSKGLSIVVKVSILVASITALASLTVGSLIFSGSSEIVYKNALNRLQYETNIKSLRLIADIKNLSGDARYLAGTPPIRGIPRALNNNGIDPTDNSSIEKWESRLSTIFTELVRAKPNYLQIRYIGIKDDGRELIRVNRQGKLIKTISAQNLQKKGDTPYFKNTIKMSPGDVYLSGVTLNREFGKLSQPHTPVMRAATPVFFDHKLFGILVINMEFDTIFNDLIINTPRKLIPYVTNGKGYFLAHPDKSMTYGFDLGNDRTIQSIYPGFDLNKNNDLRDTELTSEINGHVIHVVKTYYDDANKENFFAVMLATSKENLLSDSLRLKYQGYLIITLLVILSLIVAAILSSRLMKPLQRISIAADDLAHGRKISDLPLKAGDEIGELARSFDNMNHQLEDKERELILSQGRVHHASKMASLGEMASSIAHEINTPMQTINLIAQRVQRQLKKEVIAEDIDASMSKITTSVTKISEIIDSLRKVSRDSTDDDFSDTSIQELLQDTINMTEERFKVNNIDFSIIYHDTSENTLIQCQRLQISQILINLLNNAYDAIQSCDQKWIKIDIQQIHDRVRFSISDCGKGIAIEILEKIFEPMYTTKEVGKGTGLGLSISRDIVLKHNGLIYIKKESPNTCFVLELPIIHI